ncbi:phosphoribosylglycinamide synthetase [Streptococcus mutans]|nr:phosphoribosylglycinamide synthetase [Streptococcus mutans]MCB5091046.1 phosphoribosylglycinamide synthetase [Streptococcus mutans]
MKMLKKILGCKIYIWFAALIALVGLFFYWYGMNQNNNKSADSSQSYSMVKYIEATNETVFLNVGIEKIDALSNATKVLGITIPYSQKKAIIILNYEAKLGIKRAVSINKTRENNFEIKIPKFEVIGVKLDDKHPYKLYNRSGELLSGSTEEVDTGKAATSLLTNKEQKKYLKQYSDMIKKSAEDHYKVLFKSIYPDVKLTFVYEN